MSIDHMSVLHWGYQSWKCFAKFVAELYEICFAKVRDVKVDFAKQFLFLDYSHFQSTKSGEAVSCEPYQSYDYRNDAFELHHHQFC